MLQPGSGIPFSERGGRLRGAIDLLTGRYPAFLFGGSLGRLVPVFHLHEVTPEWFEPRLQYLAENGYRTANADELATYVKRGISPGPRSIALTFDDARASLWTVAAPLLRKYGFTAITFAIPARILDADTVRPTIDDGIDRPGTVDESDNPFVTWPELLALHASGTIDVQAHTLTHASIFCSERPTGYVTPAFAADHILNRPLLSIGDEPPRFLSSTAYGAPLYVRRSRMTDGRRFLVKAAVIERGQAYVTERGGTAFFERPGWQAELDRALPGPHGEFETPAEQLRAIENELDRCQAELSARLATDTVRHIALPWGIAGSITRSALRRSRYETAYMEEMFGRQGVRPGDDPHRLMRLNGKFIQCLPGRGRQNFLSRV